MNPETVLEMRNISKSFPGIRALDHVDLELRRGEIHVLLGENGAGKSTLIKILSGAYQKDEGQILLHGQEVEITSPRVGQLLGISTVYQELNLAPRLSVTENLLLGKEPVRFGPFLDHTAARRRAQEYLDLIHLDVNPNTQVKSLGIAEQQMVVIARALSSDAGLVIMDEPTSALTSEEIRDLFRTVNNLKERGIAVIYISHRLEEIHAIGDRVTVLRDGARVGTRNICDVTVDELIKMMVGRALETGVHRTVELAHEGPPRLLVEGLKSHGFVDIDHLEVCRGELVGVYGLMGSGRTETVRAIFGADPRQSGRIYVDGRLVDVRSPADAINSGIGFLPEDRKGQGLLLGMPVRFNISLAALSGLCRIGLFIDHVRESELASEFVNQLHIRTPSLEQRCGNLSGGNQQKVVLAKWLAKKSQVMIFDEPTRGIDVGAKVEVRRLMEQATGEGRGVLMISSDLPEVIRMSDRILVMREGRIVAELRHEEADQERILALATGAVTS